MKSYSLAALTLITMMGCQTTGDYRPALPMEFTEVVEIPGQSQEQIYNKTRQWFSQYFVSGESVVDYEDKSTGTIIGNGSAKNGTDTFGLISYGFKYNIRIDTKDNKFRAMTTITNHTNTDTTNGTYDVSYIDSERYLSTETKVKDIVNNIESYLKEQQSSSNW